MERPQFFNLPNMIPSSRRHRWRHPHHLANSATIVVQKGKRHHCYLIRGRPRKGIG
jgi:hypothetical protein